MQKNNNEEKVKINHRVHHIHSMYPPQQYPHQCNVFECDGLQMHRMSLLNLDVYTIDPPGCEDADDAFSLVTDKNTGIQKLYVHIADPTTFFTANSDFFKCALNNCVTHYPSFCKPHHMLPPSVVKPCSLMDGVKPALTVIYTFSGNRCINKSHTFSYIMCDNKYKHTYEEASKKYKSGHPVFKAVNSLCKILSKERNKKYSALESVNYSTVQYNEEGNYFYLRKSSVEEKKMKQLIAELAIATNSYIAEYIHSKSDYVFTRSCDDTMIQGMKNTSAQETLSNIVKNGVSANYDNTGKSHDIVGSKMYTHSTSPLRRVSDVFIHYILKKLFISDNGISNSEAESLKNNFITPTYVHEAINNINATSKQIKTINLLDIKYRFYCAIYDIIKYKKNCHITGRFLSYVNGFLNIIIEKINNHNVYFSYCLRIKPDRMNKECAYNEKNPVFTVRCSYCRLPKNKFDTGALPQIEQLFMTQNNK